MLPLFVYSHSSCFLRRYKKPDSGSKSSDASARSGTRKSGQKNGGIGFDSRTFKGKSKVQNTTKNHFASDLTQRENKLELFTEMSVKNAFC